MEDENHTGHIAGCVQDRRCTVLDGNLPAVFGDQRGVIGQGDSAFLAQDGFDDVHRRPAGLSVDDLEHAPDRLALCLLRPPAGQCDGDGIEKCHPAFRVADQHRVADACECDPHALLARLQFQCAHVDQVPEVILIDAQFLLNPPTPHKLDLEENVHQQQTGAAQCRANHNPADRGAGARFFCGNPVLQQLRLLFLGQFHLLMDLGHGWLAPPRLHCITGGLESFCRAQRDGFPKLREIAVDERLDLGQSSLLSRVVDG